MDYKHKEARNADINQQLGIALRAGDTSLPLVSILIPAYNSDTLIADTLRSAVSQTWPRKEIIVVDDGSTDRTAVVAREFERDGVVVVSKKNEGAAAARNYAYSLCRGDYIQWLDSDDLLAPDKIAWQMKLVQEGLSSRTLLSGPFATFMYRPQRGNFVKTSLWCDLSPLEWLLRKMAENLYMQTGNWLVSRELSDAAGPWDMRLLGDDDGEYFCRVLMASDGVRFVPESRSYYRTFRFSGLNYMGTSARKVEAHWLSMKLHISYLRSMEQSKRVDAACLHYLRTWQLCFYPERSEIVEEAEQLAQKFGEPLGEPNLSWKYSWTQKAFGWSVAKPFQLMVRKSRWSVQRQWDRLLFAIDRPKSI
jgi:glycosyltransferase involved in cell wall biosynthesis